VSFKRLFHSALHQLESCWGSVPDLYMPLYVRSLEQCTMFFVHMAGSQASGDLRQPLCYVCGGGALCIR